MSRRKKDRGQKQLQGPKSTPITPVPVVVPHPVPAVPTETDERQDRRIMWSIAGTVVALLLNVVLAYLTFKSAEFAKKSAREAEEANKLAQIAQDRAAGKVQATFDFAVETTREPSVLNNLTRKKDGYDEQVLRLESVDELLRWGPYVRVANTGTEPIDAIKIEVNYLIGAAYGTGVQQLYPVPFVLNDVSTHEATAFGKLGPKQTAKVLLNQMILGQIARMNWKDFTEKDHHGIFSVSVFCRLVGSASYDQVANNRQKFLNFHWRRTGFKQDSKPVKDVLDMKTAAWIEPSKEK
jgi:hypothetical protein